MNAHQKMVAEFHEMLGDNNPSIPVAPPEPVAALRCRLIQEELDEFVEAVGLHKLDYEDRYASTGAPTDLVGAADALGDLLYVVYGAGVRMGIDLEPIFAEIHRSNMTKRGGPVRGDGKVMKPPTFERPNLVPLIEAQLQGARAAGWQEDGAA